jgi:uncharacterized protein (TIGR03435 family)
MSGLTQALNAALIDFLWQGALVGVLLWTSLFALRQRSADTRYAVGCAALGALAVLPVITTAVFYARALPTDTRAFSAAASSRTLVNTQQAVALIWTGSDFQSTAWLAPLQAWVLPLWSVGVLIFSVRLACGGAQAFALSRHVQPSDEGVHAMVSRLATRMGLDRAVRVLTTIGVDAPSVMGWLRPVILLPPASLLGLTPQQLEAVLAHELAHVRRHDYLVNILQMVVETLLFYHPAVWWTSKQIRLERELCCDDLAVRACGDALCYARALTTLEKLRVSVPSLAMGSTSGPLLFRIQRLMGATTREYGPSRVPGVVAMSLALVCVAFNVNWVRAQAQKQAARDPAFEVATIKPNKSGDQDGGDVFQPGGRWRAHNITVRELVRQAYRLQRFQIVGGPNWITSDRFDIEAKAAGDLRPPRSPDDPFVGLLMLRTLLAERFNLIVHHETRELPMYALVMARSDRRLGPQLRMPETDCGAFDFRNSPTPPPGGFCGGIKSGPGHFTGKGATIRQLALNLSPLVARPVVDRTGLSGSFDLDLEWTPVSVPRAPDTPGDRESAPVAQGPSIFTAVQEQLGLKLESTKGPVDTIVIDHVERPTED